MNESVQILHVGLHKTGTTFLQKNLFRQCEFNYHGLHGEPDWLSRREVWFEFLVGNCDQPPEVCDRFIFSDESVLLRAGGIEGAELLGRRIGKAFENPKILITIRNPFELLESTYFQSLRVRCLAMGMETFRELHECDVRFMQFEEWLGRMIASQQVSLMGLLNYQLLKRQLGVGVGIENVIMLPLEALKEQPGKYTTLLGAVGFNAEHVERLVNLPKENSTRQSRLRKERQSFSILGRKLSSSRYSLPIRGLTSLPGLRPMFERLLYSSGVARHLDSSKWGQDIQLPAYDWRSLN